MQFVSCMQLMGSDEGRDREMRQLIYSLLSPEGSLSAQKVNIKLLRCMYD